jgi:hypothetical protein
LACEKPFKEANKELKKGNAATALQLWGNISRQ